MKHIEGTFKGQKDFTLFYQAWLPEVEAKAVLLVAHGVTEHSSRYAGMAGYLASKGYAVYSFDYRGHGKSAGRPGFVEHFDYYLDDLRTFLDLVRSWHPEKKVFLYGHSMGAAVALACAALGRDNLQGLLISGVPLRSSPRVPPVFIALLMPVSWLFPKLGMTKLDSSTLSHDRKIVDSYDHDPLVYRGKLSARLGLEMVRNFRNLEGRLAQIRLPILVLHGADDRLCHPEGARIVFAKAGSQDKTLKIYPGLYHEILNEPEQLEVLADMEAWLNQRLKG